MDFSRRLGSVIWILALFITFVILSRQLSLTGLGFRILSIPVLHPKVNKKIPDVSHEQGIKSSSSSSLAEHSISDSEEPVYATKNAEPSKPICQLLNATSVTKRIWNYTVPSWEELLNPFTHGATNGPPTENETVEFSKYTIPNPNSTTPALWVPKKCNPTQSVALIIPYRNREENLRVFLNIMFKFLCKQQLEFAIIVIEQLGTTRFNRAALLNIGFRESSHIKKFDCYLLHDVDKIPEDERLPYRCEANPVQLAVVMGNGTYKQMNNEFFGGVSAVSRDHLIQTRGLSNKYYGWGGEDDDLSRRLRFKNYTIKRHPLEYSRYKTLGHHNDKHNEVNPARWTLLSKAIERIDVDGYPETRYNVTAAEPRLNGLVYWISVDLAEDM